MTIETINFNRTRNVQVPDWAAKIVLVANGIDGFPRVQDQTLTVAQFMAKQRELQLAQGRGEWDVLVYAVVGGTSYQHPFGVDNPYRTLRSRRGRAKKIATFSYMNFDFYTFTSTQEASI